MAWVGRGFGANSLPVWTEYTAATTTAAEPTAASAAYAVLCMVMPTPAKQRGGTRRRWCGSSFGLGSGVRRSSSATIVTSSSYLALSSACCWASSCSCPLTSCSSSRMEVEDTSPYDLVKGS